MFRNGAIPPQPYGYSFVTQSFADRFRIPRDQAGSVVEPARLRFDFTHFAAVTAEELSAIENLVNEQIAAGLDVGTREMSLEEAKKSGAMALFGEKYGEKVRVVQIADFSKELCGGTHVGNTSQLGSLRL